jgi:hypothetical protein
LRDIIPEWFARLPEIRKEIGWTPRLLQEIVRISKDIKYRVILPALKGQKLDTLGAAIVNEKSDIVSFADLVHKYCKEKYTLPYKTTAESLRLVLCEKDMITGNELIWNMHKALNDYRFAFTNDNKDIKILDK